MNLKITLLSSAVVVALASAAASHAAQPAASPAAARAVGLLNGNAGKAAFRVAGDAYAVRYSLVDRDGSEHVRMNRTYRGLDVIGGDFVLHSRNGVMKSISQGFATRGRPDVVPTISKDRAITEAGARFNGVVDAAPQARLVIFARTQGVAPVLAYEVKIRGTRSDSQAPGKINYYISAKTGTLLQEDDLIHDAAASGTGKSLTLGNVTITTNSVTGGYQMVDPNRGNGSTLDAKNKTTGTGTIFSDTDNVWGNNTTSDRATAAADAHYGVAATWDFYKNTFGRNGIFNDGKGARSFVHFGRSYENAFWDDDTAAMYYGDGNTRNGTLPLVALDVAGHEMTHGVTHATADLGYYDVKDTGGLNEATSDIMGTLVEFSVNNANDPGDYLIGEEIYTSNPNGTKALRYMFKQDADGYSYSCYPTGGFTAADTGQNEKYDPHLSSGVANRFFYLLAEGAVTPPKFSYTPSQLVCNSDTTIAGIGRAKAGAIWYRALTTYFTSTETYPQARAHTLQAAADLYGSGSTEYNTVARAWSAVKVD
jgi:Zn-dependent metalloprotease